MSFAQSGTCIILWVVTVFGDDTYFTCGDWMSSHDKNSLSDGVYNITSTIERSDFTDSWREVYCAFDYTRNYAWTLIESGSRSGFTSTLKRVTFIPDYGFNEDDVETFRNSLYRLSRDWIYSLYFVSDYLFSTCEFDTSFSKDWLLFRLSDLNINPFFEEFSGTCVNSVSANIRGYLCQDTTVQIWTINGTYHMHINSPSTGCGCTAWATGSSSSEDNFGFYGAYNTEFTCTATSSSTTNWWFGSDVTEYKIPTESPTTMPSVDPSFSPTAKPSGSPTKLPSVDPSGSPSQSPSDMPTSRPTTSPTDGPTDPPSYSPEIIACAEQCAAELNGNNSLTTTATKAETTTAMGKSTTKEEGSIEVTDEREGSNTSGNSNNDGLSTEFIVIIAVVSGLVVLCCIFCLLFTGVISHHVRKRDKQQMEHLSSIRSEQNTASLEMGNQRNGGNVSSNGLLVAQPGTGMLSTNGVMPVNSNDIMKDPNAEEKDGPNITWQDLAQIHALTTRAMNAMNQPKVPQVRPLGAMPMGNGNQSGNQIGNGNGNGGGRQKESQARFGEDVAGGNESDSNDLAIANGGGNDRLDVAMKLAFEENDNQIQAAGANNNGQHNELLSEGGQ